MPKTTLLNFFTPKSKSKPASKTPTTNALKPINTPKSTGKLKPEFVNGDLVWAKLDGHPWWPSLICNDQTVGNFYKTKNKKTCFHVQFFDDPVSRSWIDAKFCKHYTGPKDLEIGGQFESLAGNADVKLAAQRANNVLEQTKSERLNLVVLQIPENQENEQNDGSPELKCSRKRRRIISDSDEEDIDMDDEEEDYTPPEVSPEESEGEDLTAASESSIEVESEPEEIPVKGTRKRKMSQKTKPSANKTFTPSVSNKTVSRLSLFQANNAETQKSDGPSTESYLHENLDFLKPDKIRDINGRKTDHEEYDKSTLHVPESFFKTLTPAMYQWWKIKERNFDVILFFKVGKFYELYHMDAAVGVQELGLIYMKGKFAHSGFPEISFGRYSDALVKKGYKVARIEQTETPDQNAQRIKGRSLPKHEKTLRREVCRIITPGTQTLDTWSSAGSIANTNNYLLAICEGESKCGKSYPMFGVCFIDTSIGTFHIGQFSDDRYLSNLGTMLANYTPCHVLCDKGNISKSFNKILKTGLANALQEFLTNCTQFWDGETTLKKLSKGKYFVKNSEEEWPSLLKKMCSDADSLGLTPASGYELALSALGACVFYLQECLIDYEVVSMKQFVEYLPFDAGQTEDRKFKPNQKLILDSVSLSNLEILLNSLGEADGSLLHSLDNCCTPFGKRMLKQWICAPPCNIQVINDRLNAVEDLMQHKEFVTSCTEIMKKMPDLDRLLMKIHCFSKGAKQDSHPDNRAILYEEVKYSKKKIGDFLTILQSYETFFNNLESKQCAVKEFKSNLLTTICLFQTPENQIGKFPNLAETLRKWKKAFDHKKAKEMGKIIPNKGTNPEYDSAIEDIAEINQNLDKYLSQQKKKLQCSKVNYKGSGNKRFQLEVPEDVANRSSVKSYEISSQRKGFKSFRTAETIAFLKQMEEAEAKRDKAQSETMAIVFREFDKEYSVWNRAIQCISTLDVLVSMTAFCSSHDGEICRPEIVDSDQPFIEIVSARHPCVSKTYSGDEFIPNDTYLGKCENYENTANCMVLTGPNMGGKSTLMRQVGLVTVLAHLGCYVPAEKCRLTLVDRIFTRLGASDRIMSGESTFYIELSETSSILKHATKHSLVLVDELGRGTATYDGTAIASAVVKEISTNVNCRTIFSTHYHSLVDDLKNDPSVKLTHMSCMVENEDLDDEHPAKETLTFLYKLAEGACPKSYGFHAARLAEVPEEVIKMARQKSAKLEQLNNSLKKFTAAFL